MEQELELEKYLQKPEFKKLVIGIHVYHNAISFCLHPIQEQEDISLSYLKTITGRFSKKEILSHIQSFDDKLRASSENNSDDSKSAPPPSAVEIVSTSISFPGPIDNGTVEVQNWWTDGDNHFSYDDFKSMLISSDRSRFSLINDIQALGQGLILADDNFGLEDDFSPLWKPPAMDVMPTLYPLYFSAEASAVLYIAHGLGAAFVVPIDSTDSYRVIASEWGHSLVQVCGSSEADFAEEQALIDFLTKKQGNLVEWEDVCSTRGLRNCYYFETRDLPKSSKTRSNNNINNNSNTNNNTNNNNLNNNNSNVSSKTNKNCNNNNFDNNNSANSSTTTNNNNNNSNNFNKNNNCNSNDSEDDRFDPIEEIAKDPSEPHAAKALAIHFKFLMRFARMCAISFSCRSVFVTYAVFDTGTEWLTQNISSCRDEFMHFTKSEWVSNVSVFVQTSKRNIASYGVMYHALQSATLCEEKAAGKKRKY